MIDKLIKLADYFDKKGLIKEANQLDQIIKESSACNFFFIGLTKLLGCGVLSRDCPKFKISSTETINGYPINNKLSFTDNDDATKVQGMIISDDIQINEDRTRGYVDVKFSNIKKDTCSAYNWDSSERDSDCAFAVVRFYCEIKHRPSELKGMSKSETTILEGVSSFDEESGDNEKINFPNDGEYVSWIGPNYGYESGIEHEVTSDMVLYSGIEKCGIQE